MDNVKIMGIPKEVRGRFNEECRNALLDTRNDEHLSLSPSRASLLLKQRILGGVQVRLSFQVTPDPLTKKALFSEDDLFSLSDAAWNHLVAVRVQQAAQEMKADLAKDVDEQEDPLESLRDHCYAEIISYKVEGEGTVFKFIGDASLGELEIAARQYAEKKNRARKRETRCTAIIRRMKQRGATDETTVAQALERKATLRAV